MLVSVSVIDCQSFDQAQAKDTNESYFLSFMIRRPFTAFKSLTAKLLRGNAGSERPSPERNTR